MRERKRGREEEIGLKDFIWTLTGTFSLPNWIREKERIHCLSHPVDWILDWCSWRTATPWNIWTHLTPDTFHHRLTFYSIREKFANDVDKIRFAVYPSRSLSPSPFLFLSCKPDLRRSNQASELYIKSNQVNCTSLLLVTFNTPLEQTMNQTHFQERVRRRQKQFSLPREWKFRSVIIHLPFPFSLPHHLFSSLFLPFPPPFHQVYSFPFLLGRCDCSWGFVIFITW